MSEKMEFEDRSDRVVPAKLVMMVEIDIKSAGMPDVEELAELVNQVSGMGQSLRNAQGKNWHVEDVNVDSFPPNDVSEAFNQLIKMFNLAGIMAVWASTLSRMYAPLSDMIEPAKKFSEASKWLGGYIHDLITARKGSDKLIKHCEECDQCREFYQKFEDDSIEWTKTHSCDASAVEESLRSAETVLQSKDREGCN